MIDCRLKVFRSVALNLSFTKASQELFISQPAISKHIQELEGEFHTRLFNRMGNKISLTHTGQLLLDHCETILKDYQKLDFEMNALRNKYSGELRIGASTTIAQYVLPTILAAFIEQYPQLSVSLLNGNSREVEAALQEGRIDLGMVEGVIRQPQLKYTMFMKDELVSVVHKHSRLAQRDEISLKELQSVPLALRERGSGTLDVFVKALQKCNLVLSSMNVMMYLGSTEGIKLFLEHSDCMGVVSVRSISKELYAGDFKVVEIENLKMEREFDFVQKRGEEGGLQEMLVKFITSRYTR
jgi:LysR family transcriptional regulator, transcriptional activator of the cysJI operon